jgi:uncharacterized repeat protein (TIGR04076 family)
VDQVKVTVIKRLNTQDIFGDKPPVTVNEAMTPPQCDHFKDGQEFIMGLSWPPDFCSWAYADIQRDIVHILLGGDYPFIQEKGTAIACCTDGLRPVVFKIERIPG